MKLNRYRLEMFCTFVAVMILFAMTAIVILAIADETFYWNIFPPGIEKVLVFLIGALGVILGSCVLVSIMINLSIIAIKITSIDGKIKADTAAGGGENDG